MRRFNIKTLESKAEKSSLLETGGRKTGSGHQTWFEYILNFRLNSAIFVTDGRNGKSQNLEGTDFTIEPNSVLQLMRTT